jgi:lipopolysaccharide export system protein LptA
VRAALRKLYQILLVVLITCSVATTASAQLGNLTNRPAAPALTKNEPVTFSADEVDYDKDKDIVTATGHVEAWQNDHVMRADKITFDRNNRGAASNRSCRAVGTRLRSFVCRLRRDAEQHERRHPEGYARAFAAKR